MSTRLPETAVLHPRSPTTDLDPDSWHEYTLKDAEVYQNPSLDVPPVSLLLASEHNPLTLVGRLHAPRSAERALYVDASSIPKHGQAVVIESVRSFAYGQYEDGTIAIWAAGKAGWFLLKPSRGYREVFTQMTEAIKLLYWLADFYGGRDGEDPQVSEIIATLHSDTNIMEGSANLSTMEKVLGYKEFLLASMIGKKEGVEWESKEIFRWLCQNYPQELAVVRERMFGKPGAKRAGRKSEPRQESVGSAEGSLKRKRGRPSKAERVDAFSAGRQTPVASTEKPDGSMPPPSRKGRPPKSRRASSRLSASTYASEDIDAERMRTPSRDDSDDEHPLHAHKGKSALRLKPGKASKGGGKGGKAPANDSDEDEYEADELAHSPTNLDQPRKRRKTPVKHRPTSSGSDEGIDIPSSPSSSHSSHNPAITTARKSPAEPYASGPSHLPNDPVQENTYACPLSGCNTKVYESHTAASQKLIREHFALHAYDDDRRVQLVKKLALPGVGSEHLMKRIRERVAAEGFGLSEGAREGVGVGQGVDEGGQAGCGAKAGAVGNGVRGRY